MILRALLLASCLTTPAIAAETLDLFPVFNGADQASYIRVVNPTEHDGKVTATIKSPSAEQLGTWSNTVNAGTAPQFGIDVIAPDLEQPISLELTTNFGGSVQHVVWNSKLGLLSNISNCVEMFLVDTRLLTNVHSTLLGSNYPSEIIVSNKGKETDSATLEVYDSVTGERLGTYETENVEVNGHLTVPVSQIERAISFMPADNQYHLSVKLVGSFAGSISHLVTNVEAGAVTDMTRRCAVFGRSVSTYSTFEPQLSYIGDWEYTDHPDKGIIDYSRNIRLGPSNLEGLAFAGWLWQGDIDNRDESLFEPTRIALVEQTSDGDLILATDKYVSSAWVNGAGSVQVADFNNDGKDDLFFPAHNESPFVDKPSTVFLSNDRRTFTKQEINDNLQAHGATTATINGRPTVVTVGFGPDAYNTYQFISGRFQINNFTREMGNMGVTVADFLGTGQPQFLFTDVATGPGTYDYENRKHYHLIYEFEDGKIANSPTVTLKPPYFNGKPKYEGYESHWDPYTKTHSPRAYSYDINNDGNVDALIDAWLWPGKLLPDGGHRTLYKLQIWQNNGDSNFTDVTDELNTEWNENGAPSSSPFFITNEDGSLFAIFTEGWTVPDEETEYNPWHWRQSYFCK